RGPGPPPSGWAVHADGHRLWRLGRGRGGRDGHRRHLLLRRAPRRDPPAALARPDRLHRRPEAGRALMAWDEGLYEWTKEALAPLGNVSMRRMMGAAVLYLDGIVFAVIDDEIWFTADAERAAIWAAAGFG